MKLEEIDAQLTALKSHPELQTIVAVYIFAGLRREELCWLTLEDVDFEAGGYRALLDSILYCVQAKTGVHGVRYLNKLNSLAASILNWKSFEGHVSYKNNLRQQHGRKSCFRPRYKD